MTEQLQLIHDLLLVQCEIEWNGVLEKAKTRQITDEQRKVLETSKLLVFSFYLKGAARMAELLGVQK